MEQQELLRTAMFRFGMNRDQFANRIGTNKRTLDKWLLPVGSNDFREMPSVASKYVEELFNSYRIRFDISPLGIYHEGVSIVGENAMSYKTLVPAQDWVCVVFPVAPRNELVVWRVAVWALTEEGEVVGLISVPGGGEDDEVMGKTCGLIPPPPLRSVYKHISELDKNEQTVLMSGKPLKIEP